jgi:hypothetical protein
MRNTWRRKPTLLDDSDIAWIAAELAVEVNRINCEQRMSINNFRQALSHIPGGANMTMRYGNGGRTQIFQIGEDEVEVGPDASASDIEAALTKKKLQPSATQ